MVVAIKRVNTVWMERAFKQWNIKTGLEPNTAGKRLECSFEIRIQCSKADELSTTLQLDHSKQQSF